MKSLADFSERLRAVATPLTSAYQALEARFRPGKTSPKQDEQAEAQWRENNDQILGADSPSGAQSPVSVSSYLSEVTGEDGQGMLSIHNLAKSYKARRVVEDVSLHVKRGEAVGLLGPNGAGKTTVFYMITGLVKPDKGIISLDGYDVTPLPMYRRARLGIGYLPQEASIFRGLTVEENIRAVLEITQPD